MMRCCSRCGKKRRKLTLVLLLDKRAFRSAHVCSDCAATGLLLVAGGIVHCFECDAPIETAQSGAPSPCVCIKCLGAKVAEVKAATLAGVDEAARRAVRGKRGAG